jgi:hypothetical protein
MKEEQLTTALSFFSPITLQEMNDIRLMNRLDTKFVTTKSVILDFLESAKTKYRIQVVNDETLTDYRTVYLDTFDREMYMAHHNARKVREKIRVRTYISSQLTFLEVKNKDNHGRTDKKRIRVDDISTIRQDGGDGFLHQHSWYNLSQLVPQLENSFERMTLVDNEKTERLTIDTNITFKNLRNQQTKSLGDLVIVELKRDGRKVSYAAQLLHQLYIRRANISKYCIGLSMTDAELKQNRFKHLIMQINKINDINN